MITPEAMEHVHIVVPQRYGYRVIDTLYSLNLFHVKDPNNNSYVKNDNLPYDGNRSGNYRHSDHGDTNNDESDIDSESRDLSCGRPLARAEQLSALLIELRSVKHALGIQEHAKSECSSSFSLHEFESLQMNVKRLSNRVSQMQAKLGQLSKDKEALQHKIRLAQGIAQLSADKINLNKLRYVNAWLGTVKGPSAIRKKLSEERIAVEMNKIPLEDRSLVLLVGSAADKARIEEILNNAGFAALGAGDDNMGDNALYNSLLNKGNTPSQFQKKLGARLTTIKTEHGRLAAELKNLASGQRRFLCRNEFVLEEEVKKSELPLKFATTSRTFVASGYVPKKQVRHMARALDEATGGRLLLEHSTPGHDEQVPVKLSNPKMISNFESLTRLYELPAYLEVDPSFLMALTFPLFFGFMLGDVGYGIVTLLLFLYVKKKFPAGKQLLNVLIYASIVTIAFGFVFGEYFGFEHIGRETGESLCEKAGICLHKEIIEGHGEKVIVYSFPRILARMEETTGVFGMELLSVLVIGAIVGAIHLNFGLLIGFINVYRAHGLRHAILDKLSWFVLEGSLILVVLALINILIRPMLFIGVAGAIISIIMLYLGEGARGIIEIPALFSNTLSYMRLGAVGLSSVGLAVVVNEKLAQPFLEKGGIFILVGLVIMVLGHLVNIALGIIGPFLHSIRLHYVEFFSKFFHGGGEEYNPFGYVHDKR